MQRLHAKWPGVFKGHRRKNEVMMRWDCRQPRVGTRVAKRFDSEVAALTPALNRPHVVCATTMPAYAAASTSATATPAALRLALTACKFTHAPVVPACRCLRAKRCGTCGPTGRTGRCGRWSTTTGTRRTLTRPTSTLGRPSTASSASGGGQGAGARAEGAYGGAKEEEEEEELEEEDDEELGSGEDKKGAGEAGPLPGGVAPRRRAARAGM